MIINYNEEKKLLYARVGKGVISICLVDMSKYLNRVTRFN